MLSSSALDFYDAAFHGEENFLFAFHYLIKITSQKLLVVKSYGEKNKKERKE